MKLNICGMISFSRQQNNPKTNAKMKNSKKFTTWALSYKQYFLVFDLCACHFQLNEQFSRHTFFPLILMMTNVSFGKNLFLINGNESIIHVSNEIRRETLKCKIFL